VTVHSLEAHRTTIRFVNRGTDLHFLGAATALEQPTEDGLSTRITFEGSYQGAPYTGVAMNAGVLSFRGSGITFPLRGHMTSRSTRVELDGLFSDVFDIGAFDAKVRATGSSLSELHPFLHIRPPPSRRFDIEAQLTQTNDVYEFTRLKAKIGTTDLTGEATYDRSGDRPRVRAALRSESADVTDLRPLVGIRASSQEARGTSPKEPAKQRNKNAETRVLPARQFRVDRLNALDASVRFEAKKLTAAAMPMLDSLRLAAELAGGVLELKPLDIGIGGGHVVGALTFDARQQPPLSRVRGELRDLRLERLIPALAQNARSAGAIRGDVSIAGQGNSIAAMLGNATGSFTARIEDGSISNLADAKLGLNFGKVLAVMLRGDRNIAINCGAIAFDVRAGRGKSRTVVLDTAQTHTTGVGTLDLKEERWGLLLSPEPKKPGLLTRRASIRVDGSFRDAQASIEERVELGGAARTDGSQSDRSASASACTSAKR
jgi:uncharacterized protein involved in outer membrane biogenesis